MTLVKIQNGGFEALVLLEAGGRIVSYHRIGQPNLLESDPALWNEREEDRLIPTPEMLDFRGYNGHEVWLGPQSQWWKQQTLNKEKFNSDLFWPPDPFISFGEYNVEEYALNRLIIKGKPSPISGVSFVKQIRLEDDGSLFFGVEAENVRDTAVAWDLWLITRVQGMNENYVPIASPSDFRLGEPSHPWQGSPSYRIADGYFSFTPWNFDRQFQECTGKAYLNTLTPVIYAKCGSEWLKLEFEHHDAATIHPEQAEIELYNFVCADPKRCLLELEYHAPYKTLRPGEKMSTWSRWSVGEAPSDICGSLLK